jgi:hypothetical protein
MKRSALALVALALTLIFAVASAAAEDPHVERPKAGAPEITTAAPIDLSSGLLRAQGYVEQQQVGAYIADVAEAERVLVAMGGVRDVLDAYVAAVTPPPPPPPVRAAQPAAPSGVFSGSGSCFGGPIPDYIVQRESGGNPMAQNPSGAFGCYQIMPEWWSGSCSGMDRYTIDGQKQCASLIWNGGAGAGNWSETLG